MLRSLLRMARNHVTQDVAISFPLQVNGTRAVADQRSLRIFVSAVSRELESFRVAISKTLLKLDMHPITQDLLRTRSSINPGAVEGED